MSLCELLKNRRMEQSSIYSFRQPYYRISDKLCVLWMYFNKMELRAHTTGDSAQTTGSVPLSRKKKQQWWHCYLTCTCKQLSSTNQSREYTSEIAVAPFITLFFYCLISSSIYSEKWNVITKHQISVTKRRYKTNFFQDVAWNTVGSLPRPPYWHWTTFRGGLVNVLAFF